MKTQWRALTAAVILMVAQAAFGQDIGGSSKLCETPETTGSNQIEIDSTQWITPGAEAEVLRGMTGMVREKVRLDLHVGTGENQDDGSKIADDAMESDALN